MGHAISSLKPTLRSSAIDKHGSASPGKPPSSLIWCLAERPNQDGNGWPLEGSWASPSRVRRLIPGETRLLHGSVAAIVKGGRTVTAFCLLSSLSVSLLTQQCYSRLSLALPGFAYRCCTDCAHFRCHGDSSLLCSLVSSVVLH